LNLSLENELCFVLQERDSFIEKSIQMEQQLELAQRREAYYLKVKTGNF